MTRKDKYENKSCLSFLVIGCEYKLASLSKKQIVDSEDAAHAGQTRQLTLYAVSTSALWGEADMICTCEYKCISAL